MAPVAPAAPPSVQHAPRYVLLAPTSLSTDEDPKIAVQPLTGGSTQCGLRLLSLSSTPATANKRAPALDVVSDANARLSSLTSTWTPGEVPTSNGVAGSTPENCRQRPQPLLFPVHDIVNVSGAAAASAASAIL